MTSVWPTFLLLISVVWAVHIEHRPDSHGRDKTSGEWCQAWKSLLCGSDGVTYWNECTYVKNKAKNPDLEILSVGACPDVECQECFDGDTAVKLRVCGSNNMLMESACQLTCLLEDYPMSREIFEGCQSQYPSVHEMEIATPGMFTVLVEQLLIDALPPSKTKRQKRSPEDMMKADSTGIEHLISDDFAERPPFEEEKDSRGFTPEIGESIRRSSVSTEGVAYEGERGQKINKTIPSGETDGDAKDMHNKTKETDTRHSENYGKLVSEEKFAENHGKLYSASKEPVDLRVQYGRYRRQEEYKKSTPPPTTIIATTEESTPMETSSGKQRDFLEPFTGYLHSNGQEYRVSAKKGWMDEISWVTAPENFLISAEKLGRLKYILNTGALRTGYEYFTIIAGQSRSKSKMNLTLNNATLVLVADAISDRLNCTRLVPVSVKLYDLPSIQVQAAGLERSLPENFPKQDLDGFMKEKFVQKINDAIEKNLYTRMHRVGCLKWKSQGSEKCFGAFQSRYCSQ